MTLPERSEELAARIRDAEAALRTLRAEYLASLAEDDRISRVAFLLYQRDVLAEDDWQREVTWEHWWELQIDSERDAYRERAVELLRIIEDSDHGTSFIVADLATGELSERLSPPPVTPEEFIGDA